jgi:hypothetical protein
MRRANIAAQCTGHCAALAVRSPHTSIFYFRHHYQLLCNSAIDVIFPILACCNHVYWILFVPIIYCYSTPFFSLSLCRTQYYVVLVFSPWHLAYLYMVFDCSFIVYSSIQPPTKCLSPHFFSLPLHPYFLALGCSIICSCLSSSHYTLFSVHW